MLREERDRDRQRTKVGSSQEKEHPTAGKEFFLKKTFFYKINLLIQCQVDGDGAVDT